MVTIYVLGLCGDHHIRLQTHRAWRRRRHRTHGRKNSGQNSIAMNKPLGIALLAVGIMLIIFGLNASDSFGSDVSRFFTGKPTDKPSGCWWRDSFRGVGFFMWLGRRWTLGKIVINLSRPRE